MKCGVQKGAHEDAKTRSGEEEDKVDDGLKAAGGAGKGTADEWLGGGFAGLMARLLRGLSSHMSCFPPDEKGSTSD